PLLLLPLLFLRFTSAVQIRLFPAYDPPPNPRPPAELPANRAPNNQPYQGPNPFAINPDGPLGPAPMGVQNYQMCSDHPPGVCCQGRIMPFGVPGQPPFQNYRIAHFFGLTPLDIGAVYQPREGVNWQPGVQYNGCSGRPVGSKGGPGDWRHPEQGNSNILLSGASYLRLPQGAPANENEAAWAEAEGILGMVTGQTRWVARSASNMAQSLIAQAEAALKGGGGSLPKRDIRSREQGTVVAKTPSVRVWADVIVLNGTIYKEENAGSPIYKSEAGEVLNFTSTAT
ncbi:MAG: hypothetical protein Q9224_006090, partial [Gallowayella concinna]